MTRSSRRRAARAIQQQQAAAEIVPYSAAVGGFVPSPGGGSGISAGNPSPDRGYVYFPNLRAKYHFARAPRLEVIKKSRWLSYNDGNGRMLRQLAEWLGPVSVHPATSDLDWNEEMEGLWSDLYLEGMSYDGSGKFTAETYQAMINFMMDRDGDALNLWTRKPDSDEPTVMLYDSTSIGDQGFFSQGRRPPGEWLDGVRIGPMHRPLQYALLPDAGEDPRILDAYHTMMFAHYEVPEAVRGTPALVHAADNCLDIREIDTDIKRAIKIRGLFGLAIHSDGAIGPAPKSVDGRLVAANVPASTRSGANSTTEEVTRYREEVFSNGGIVRLGSGQKIATVADERDATSQDSVKADIYANIARGLGVRVQFLYMLEKLTGPGIRMVLSDVQDWRERRLKRMVPFVKLDYRRRVEWLIRSGLIRAPKDPRFWLCSHTFPRSLTIDAGRDQAGRINALKSGLTNLRTEYGEQGDQWRPETRQRLEEIDWILNEAASIAKGDENRARLIVATYFGGAAAAPAAEIEDETSQDDAEEDDAEDAPPPPQKKRPGAK